MLISRIEATEQNINFYNILRFGLIAFVFIVLVLLPQVNVEAYINPTITSKLVLFLYGGGVILLMFITKLLMSKRIRVVLNKLDIALFVMLVYITLNKYVFQSTYGFSIRYIELLGLGFMYLVFRSIDLKGSYCLLLSVVVAGIVQAVHGNLQMLGLCHSNHSVFKITGSFFNPGPYAGFLASVWPISLGMYLFKENVVNDILKQCERSVLFGEKFAKNCFEYIPLLGVVCIATVILATRSRASWLAVIVSSVVLLEYRYSFLEEVFKKIDRNKKYLIIVATIIVSGMSLFCMYCYKKDSANGRLFIWKITTEMILETPVFGVGFDRFKKHYMNHQGNYFNIHGETEESLLADNVYSAFNSFLQLVSENGFVGLILLIIIIYIILIQPLKPNCHYLGVFLKVCLLAISVFSFFSYAMQILPIKLILTLTLAILSSLGLNSFEVLSFKRKEKSRMISGIVLAVGLFLWCKSFAYTAKLENGFKKWNAAITLHNYGHYKEAIKQYGLVYQVFKNDGEFLMNYGKALSMASLNDAAIRTLERSKKYLNNIIIETALGDAYKKGGDYKLSEKSYILAVNMIPSRFYPKYLLTKLYYESGRNLKALDSAEKLLSKNIKIPSKAILEMQQEVRVIIKKIMDRDRKSKE